MLQVGSKQIKGIQYYNKQIKEVIANKKLVWFDFSWTDGGTWVEKPDIDTVYMKTTTYSMLNEINSYAKLPACNLFNIRTTVKLGNTQPFCLYGQNSSGISSVIIRITGRPGNTSQITINNNINYQKNITFSGNYTNVQLNIFQPYIGVVTVQVTDEDGRNIIGEATAYCGYDLWKLQETFTKLTIEQPYPSSGEIISSV